MSISLSVVINVIRTIVDLSAVCLILYYLILTFKNSMKTMQLFKGVLVILIVKLMTSVFNLTTLDYLVDTVITWGVLAIIIIFQPEIRTLLERMGQTKSDDHKKISNDKKVRIMDELVDAISTLAKEKTGALITFERDRPMDEYINTGTTFEADIKKELILSIFYEGTALHDGAMIIKGDRIVCAAAFYPPTNQELPPLYGARHRAGIGISEITDSLTVIVSEETGNISFAINGQLKKIPPKELRASLVNELEWFKSDVEDTVNE